MIFETTRLVARRFGPHDLEPFVAMRRDPQVARFQGWESYCEDDGRRFIEEMELCEPGQPGWFQFALEEKESGTFLGDCALDAHADHPGLARIGYTVARPFWNRGFATEAVASLATFAFDSLGFHRITASVDPYNMASRRVLEKAGFAKLGRFADSEWFKGEWPDDLVYAKTR